MKKILLVDDSKDVRELVAATLDTGEYELLMASNGADAVAAAGRDRPDIVIMDLAMPGTLNGVEATRLIKQNQETKDIAVVMLSGSSEPKLIEQCLQLGAADYLTKPFSPLQLIDKVEEILGASA
jgi:CheY-like chemotaxis protein